MPAIILVSVLQGLTQTYNYQVKTDGFIQFDETRIDWDLHIRKGVGSNDFALWKIQIRWDFDPLIMNFGAFADDGFAIEAGTEMTQNSNFFKDVDCTVINNQQFQWAVTGPPDKNERMTIITDEWIRVATFTARLQKDGEAHHFASLVPAFAFQTSGAQIIVERANTTAETYNGSGATVVTRDATFPGPGITISDRQLAGYWFTGEGDWSTTGNWNQSLKNEFPGYDQLVPGENASVVINGNVTIYNGAVTLSAAGEGRGGQLTVMSGPVLSPPMMPANDVGMTEASAAKNKIHRYPERAGGIDKNNLGASLTIAPGAALTVDKLFNDHDDGADGIMLQSPAGHGAAGSLIHSNTGVPASVQRYIARHSGADVDGWHLLSAPVSGQDIKPEFFPSSTEGAGYHAVDFYRWNEANSTWLNIKDAGNAFAHTQFQVGHGYLMAYGVPAAKDTWGDRTHTFAGPANVEARELSNLSLASEGTYAGWHLLGNPFASALKWNDASGWNLNNAGSPHVWDDTANDYKEITGADVIPAMNGLMIKVTGATNAITLNPDNRVHSGQAWYKQQERDDRIRLLARDPSINSAKGSTVIFREDAQKGMDRYDSYMISGFGPVFFSRVEQARLSVNALPEYYDGLTIPFGFDRNPVSQGTEFSIELESKLRELDDKGYELYLQDLKLDVMHNLSEKRVYEFTWQPEDDINRFLLHLAKTPVSTDEPGNDHATPGNAWTYNNNLYLFCAEEGTTVSLFDISGCELMKYHSVKGEQVIHLNLPAGIYMVRMINNNNTKTIKVTLN